MSGRAAPAEEALLLQLLGHWVGGAAKDALGLVSSKAEACVHDLPESQPVLKGNDN